MSQHIGILHCYYTTNIHNKTKQNKTKQNKTKQNAASNTNDFKSWLDENLASKLNGDGKRKLKSILQIIEKRIGVNVCQWNKQMVETIIQQIKSKSIQNYDKIIEWQQLTNGVWFFHIVFLSSLTRYINYIEYNKSSPPPLYRIHATKKKTYVYIICCRTMYE